MNVALFHMFTDVHDVHDVHHKLRGMPATGTPNSIKGKYLILKDLVERCHEFADTCSLV